MSGYLTAIMFFSVPIGAIIFFVVSLVLFLSAKSENRHNPDAFSVQKIQTRKILLIVSSVIVGVILAVVITLITLLYMALAYM